MAQRHAFHCPQLRIRNAIRLLSALACMVLMTACCTQHSRSAATVDDPVQQLKTITAHYGTLPSMHVRFGLRITPPNGDRVRFVIEADFDKEGRVALQAFEKGYGIFNASIDSDGTMTMNWLIDKWVVSGNLSEMEHSNDQILTMVTAHLQLLLNELRLGPPPKTDEHTITTGKQTETGQWIDVSGPRHSFSCRLDASGKQIEQKIIRDSKQPDEVVTLDYSRHKTFQSRLLRPCTVELSMLKNQTKIRASIRTVEKGESNTASFEARGDWERINIPTFLQRLRETADKPRQPPAASDPSPTGNAG